MSPNTRRLTTIAVATLAASTCAVAGANAAVSVSSSTPTNGQTLTATVSSPPAGATKYTLAECNVTNATPANWGRDCNASSAVNFTPVTTTTRSITVNSSFANTSFVPGLSPLYGASTRCKGASTARQCAVVVSWYDASTAPVGVPQKANITF